MLTISVRTTGLPINGKSTFSEVEGAGERQVHIWHVKVIILGYLALVVIAHVEI